MMSFNVDCTRGSRLGIEITLSQNAQSSANSACGDFTSLLSNPTPWWKTKWRRQRVIHDNPRINDANSIQQGSKAYVLSQVISLETGTVITLEPIKSCTAALPSPKGFGRGLARSSLAL